MNSRPFGILSRILLVACVAMLGTSALYGQSSTASKPMPQGQSKVDIFLGYSYLAPHATVETNIPGQTCVPTPQAGVISSFLTPNATSVCMPMSTTYYDKLAAINAGAIGSVAYYFNKYLGGQVEYENSPDGPNDGISTLQTGIIARYPMDQMIPFVHALVGAARIGGPNAEPYTAHPYTWGPALTVGGGLDYGLPFFDHHLSLRLFQADYEYLHANFGPEQILGGRVNSNTARLSTGLVIHLGSLVPPPPVTYACSASPASVYPGGTVTVTGTASNLNPKKTAKYSWTGQGVTVSSSSSTASIDTSKLAPGTYKVMGHVTEGSKPGQSADCTASFTVKQFEPPTVSCVASPMTVKPGENSTITATGVSPQNRPLTYSYSASAGSISGSGKTATLTTTGAPSGPITVTCKVQDDVGQTASSTTTVDVQAPPPPPTPHTETLCSIAFTKDRYRPTRVDNIAKACLDDVALNAQRQPNATLVLVGNSAPGEKMGATKAAERAVNAKAYLVKDKGIDASRIQVRTGNAGSKEVLNYLVPAGANFENDIPGTQPVNESELHHKK